MHQGLVVRKRGVYGVSTWGVGKKLTTTWRQLESGGLSPRAPPLEDRCELLGHSKEVECLVTAVRVLELSPRETHPHPPSRGDVECLVTGGISPRV